MVTIRVVTAEQASQADAAAIASGIPSFDLMRAAGERAAAAIAARYPDQAQRALIVAGPGNNGGDGWVVARVLAAHGLSVHVEQVGALRSDDARRAAAEFTASQPSAATLAPSLVVDALLGTGVRGAPRGEVAGAIGSIARYRQTGVPVISLDVPSGLDATTGAADGSVEADWTITFGAIKRGLLLARGHSGAITLIDIGLGVHGSAVDDAPRLVDASAVRDMVPPIPAESHKGIRRRIGIVGGTEGMAGATMLAARGAVRSGIGMVRLIVHQRSVPAVQVGVVEATAAPWPTQDSEARAIVSDYAHALLIGPGLGRNDESRQVLDRMLRVFSGPVVLDADALSLFAGRLDALRSLLNGRQTLLTPHAGECGRLLGRSADDVLAQRFDVAFELARSTGATVLLKGVPTVIAAPDGRTWVSASGTPVLAAAGSGDVLGGIAATLLAQQGDALVAGACAAWIHGRAGEIANAGRPIRGVTLDDVVAGLSEAWRFEPASVPPVMLELPAVGDRRR